MNPLEKIKEKLKLKPIVKSVEPVEVIIPVASKKQDVKIHNITFIDERKKNKDFDITELSQQLESRKLNKVVTKDTVKLSEPQVAPPTEKKAPTSKVKKIAKPALTIVEEEDEEEDDLDTLLPREEEVAVVEKKETAKKGRKTKRPEKGISVLSPEDWMDIDKAPVIERLPPKKAHVNYKVSSYYMNNREIFVNFINSLFQPYRDEVLDDTKEITCESMSNQNADFSLLGHQKLVRDYMNLYTPYRGLLVYHGLGSGKCHRKDTPIIMSDGTIKLIQDIQVGDLLMGDDSQPRQVLSLARGKDKMYDIIPIKGEKYTVNQEHILCLKMSGFPEFNYNNHAQNTNYNVQWIQDNRFCSKTFTFNESKNNKEEMRINACEFYKEIQNNKNTCQNIFEISVKDYLNLSKSKKAKLKGYKVPVEFPEKELPFDPYMIGYWLGDGTGRSSEIASQDSTVLHYFRTNLPKHNLYLSHRSKYSYGITGDGRYHNNIFLNTLKDLDMINNKHIPLIYKCNSRENRLKLLAGLIDSDGSFSNGGFEFTQKNETLMDDVVFLARSLGFACYKHSKNTSWTYKGVKKYGTAWRICINGFGLEEIPTLVPRKQPNERKQIKDPLVTGINVKYVNEDDYYGFMLDGNCRYLMGDFTVTHNTCTSIALAEGMKSSRKIIVMTPASLRRNYIEEIKKCGDPIYKTNQYWEWISTKKHPELLETLSSILNLSVEYIEKKGGAWLVDVRKPSNYADLSADNGKSLNEQIDEMIQSKYKFINYNGLRRDKLKDMTDNFEKNIFDNSVIVIDEAHNLISRIVNKLSKEKEVPTDKHGNKERLPFSLALVLYELLMNAQNARVILLTGTPIINYPNEIGILFNILRGYIKTWEIPLDIKGGQKVDKEMLFEIFKREKVMDYMDYNLASKKLTITRNPFGFENKEKKESGYHGVTNKKKEYTDKSTGKTVIEDRGTISDDDFERKVIRILADNKIEVLKSNIIVHLYKALPDKFDDFANRFIEGTSGNVKNIELFKKRIMGLTSYFRSAQEKLLPRYEKASDYKIIKIPMSDYQFNIYEEARQQERKVESKSKQKKGSVDENGIFKEPSSTYRIFSRLYCNFVMPRPPGRPLPNEEKEPGAQGEKEDEEDEKGGKEQGKEQDKNKKGKSSKKENEDDNLTNLYDRVLKEGEKKGTNDLEGEWDGNVEGDEMIQKIADSTYDKRIQNAIDYLREHASEYLSPSGLETYSPKYLHMLENIQDKEHIGLHLVYSQFRTLEGIGIFKMVLEQNGFAQFKIKKNSSGNWELDMDEEDRGKPTFALYTGTESAEEKEVIRNIYNSNWDNIAVSSPALYEELKNTANNNNVGEIIKVLMITASGSEGINLRNTRYVHIMEPYWHPARLDQVIGRARRICSHKDLPEKLQTVEVFIYLMTFTPEQIKSDKSIELKLKDLSKKTYKLRPDKPDEAKIPFTSDETLFEISTIKEEVSNQIITAIKEASIDCATYSKRGSKEQLHCLQFGQVAPSKFSYNPSIGSDETDTVATINKKVIEWRGKEITIKGKKYVYRKIDDRVKNVYDYESYKLALEKPGVEPVLVGTLEINQRGEPVFKQI